MTPAAQEKVDEALEKIEAAQVLLMEASQSLSPVIGMVKEWTLVGKEYDRVKALWYKVRNIDGKFRLDSEPKEAPQLPKRGMAFP